MPLFVLEKGKSFPPVHLSEPDGLLAIGGDLSEDRLIEAYRNGIFPWYQGDHILWWCPDPRFVLYPDELKISKSMSRLIRDNGFRFTVNQSCEDVMRHCKSVPRKDQNGTWINEDMIQAYTRLHKKGIVHSAECWQKDKLVGGLYGVRMGNVFFGESMFSLKTNASKYAFIKYTQFLQIEGVRLIDCQVYTEHMESLGARMIPRSVFVEQLGHLVSL